MPCSATPHYSAPDLAKLDTQFTEWLLGAGIILADSPGYPNLHEVALKTRDAALKFPAWMVDKSSPYYLVPLFSKYHALRDKLVDQVTRSEECNTTNVYSDTESMLLSLSLPTILSTSSDLELLGKTPLNPKEATWRVPVNNLINHAFCHASPGEQLTFFTECTLSLPKSDSSIHVGLTANADTVILWHKLWFFERMDTSIWNECSCLAGLNVHLSVLHWATEYTRDKHSAHQLCYDLGAAQYQRRALGISDHVIFGSTCYKNITKTYASWWVKREEPDEKPYFDLKIPIDAMRFFLFLRGVVKYIDSLSPELESLNKESIIAAQSTYDGSWKATQKLALPNPGPCEDVPEETGSQTSDRMQEGDDDAGYSSDKSLWSDEEQMILALWRANCIERSLKAQRTIDETTVLPEFSDMFN